MGKPQLFICAIAPVILKTIPLTASWDTFVTGGLETEAEYKYRGHNEKCSMDKSKVRVKINGSVSISSNETGQISNQIITLNFYFLDSTCRLKFQKNGSCVL